MSIAGNRMLAFVVAILLAVVLVGPFFLARRNPNSVSNALVQRVPATHDMAQHIFTLEEFDRGLRAGNPYPRWQANFNSGYGLPWLNYYSPGFYFEAELFFWISGDGREAMFFVALVNMALSGIAFYWFSRIFFPWMPAAFGAAIYMTAPYHLLDLYHRGAMPEFSGFVFVPLIFGMTYLAGRDGRTRHIAGMGIFYGLYLFTHWPIACLLSLVIAGYAILWSALAKDWRIAARVAAGGVVGFLLSAIYWLPALAEARFIHEAYSTVFRYHVDYLPKFPPKDEFALLLNHSFFSGILFLASAVIVLATLALPCSEDDPPHRLHTRLLLLWGVFASFMATDLFKMVSQVIPGISYVLFPWRWLLIISFFTALAATAILNRLNDHGPASARQLAIYRATLAGLLMWHVWVGAEASVLWAFDNGDLKHDASRQDVLFYPSGAVSPDDLPASRHVTLVAGQATTNIVRWDTFRRDVEVVADTPATLRLRTYNFPGWKSRIDGRDAAIRSDAQGIQLIDLAPGRHTVEVIFSNTRVRTIGMLVSLCGLLLAGILLGLTRQI